MSLLIEILIVVILMGQAQCSDINDSFEYSVDRNAQSLISINSSNLSPIYTTHVIENTKEETPGKHFQVSGGPKFLFINYSDYIDYNNLSSSTQANIASNLKNRANISYSHYPNLSFWQLNKMDEPKFTILESKPKAIVHSEESIQAAVDAATAGDVIEINSGTYNESLLINKCLTIRGVDVGGGLPIIDANGLGNVIEISADHVILEGIVVTNSSKYSMNSGAGGAGILLSYSNNCSIDGIVSYNNYYGLTLEDSYNNTISRSNISDSEYGVRIYYSNNNTLEKSVVKKTITPLDIVSSIGNLIQKNVFRGNSNEVKTSNENKIIGNEESFAEDGDASIEGVIPNAEPTSPPFQTIDEEPKPHKSSEGDGEEWIPYVAPADKGEEYENFAQKAAGTLVFNPPKNMTNGTDEWIDARIGLENTSRLVQGLIGKGDVQFRNISAEANMTYIVKLESDSGFKISAKRPEAQILGTDPAVWLWLVTPLEGGNHTLILSVDLQLEKPPYNCRCVNVTYWPVTVKVLEPSQKQRLTDIMFSSYTMIAGGVAFMASLISLILLFRQLKKGKDEEK